MVVSPPASGRGSEGERKEQEEEGRVGRRGERQKGEGSKGEARRVCEGPANILHEPSSYHFLRGWDEGGLT